MAPPPRLPVARSPAGSDDPGSRETLSGSGTLRPRARKPARRLQRHIHLRLRPNLIRRLFGSFGTPRDGFSRPLALGLTTLGLAGLMLGFLPGTLSFGGAASAPAGGAAGSVPQQEIQQTLGAATQERRCHSRSLGGPLITCRTSIPMLSGPPPGPGAADASAAMA